MAVLALQQTYAKPVSKNIPRKSDPTLKIQKYPQEAKPAYTEDQARAYMQEMLPLVEQATGKKFLKAPVCKLIRTQEIVPILTKEMIPQVRAQMPQLSAQDISSAAGYLASAYAHALLGKYGTQTKVLYMLPRNLDLLKRSIKSDDAKVQQDIVKLFIAHELTHALQDQEVGLAGLLIKATSTEKSLAINSTIEGQAMFVQDKVAEALNLSETEKDVARAMVAGMPESADAADKVVYARTRQMFEDIYMRGRDFISWQYNQGGNDLVWQILKTPPTSTSVIIHPETYSIGNRETINYVAILKGLEQQFGKREWIIRNGEVGELGLRGVYNNMDESTRSEILSGVDHVQSLVAQDGDKTGSVSLFVFKDALTVKKLIPAVEKMVNANAEQLRESHTVKLESITFEDFKGIQSDVARKCVLKTKEGSKNMQYSFVRIVRGNALVECTLSGFVLQDKQIAAIAETVFTRLAAPAKSYMQDSTAAKGHF